MKEESKYCQLNNKDEVQLFFNTLFHHNNGGYICLARKNNSEMIQEFMRVEELKKYNFYDSQFIDTYISIGCFYKKIRQFNYLYSISTFYIDLDCHKKKYSKNEIMSIYDKLINGFDDGKLPRGTIVSYTGRGLSILYILENNINCLSEKTKKMRHLFDVTYLALLDKYKKFFENDDVDVDRSVRDASRIVRIPTTVNSKNNEVCHLLYINQNENGTVNYVKNFKDIATPPKRKKRHVQSNPNKIYTEEKTAFMLNARIKMLFKLANLRKNQPHCRRELMCHMVFNFSVQMGLNEECALEKMNNLNNIFVYRLTESELKSACASVSKEHNYEYSNKNIIEKLMISEDEMKMIGFSNGLTRQAEQAEKKINHQIKREERNYMIASFIEKNPKVTIVEVAERFSLSRTTINNIIKEYGVNRNTCENNVEGCPEDIKDKKVQFFYTILGCECRTGNQKPKKQNNGCKSLVQISEDADYKNNEFMNKDIINQYIQYDRSYLNYLISNTSRGYSKMFKTFQMTFERFINDIDNTDLKKKEYVILALNAIGHVYEKEIAIEYSCEPLNLLYMIIKGNKNITNKSRISPVGHIIKSLSMRDVINNINSDTVFKYNPCFEVEMKEQKPKTVKYKEKKLSHNEYVEIRSILDLADLKERRIPEAYSKVIQEQFDVKENRIGTNISRQLTFDIFEKWITTSDNKEYKNGFKIIEKNLSISNKTKLNNFMQFIIQNDFIIKTGEEVYSKLLKYLKVKDVKELNIYRKPRSDKQKRAYRIFSGQEVKWDYINSHNSNTTRSLKTIYRNMKLAKEEEKNEIIISQKKYNIEEAKKKYLYPLLKEDIIEIEMKYHDNIDESTLLEECIKRAVA